MPGAVPVTSGAAVVRALEKVGFNVVRSAGSHRILRHPDGRSVTVPVHAGRDLPNGTLRNILTITSITAEELRQLL